MVLKVKLTFQKVQLIAASPIGLDRMEGEYDSG